MTSYAPQYPSPLQISISSPSSPLSPLSPLFDISPTTSAPLLSSAFAQYSPYLPITTASPPPPPQLPPLWIWSCHQCQTSYPLGATRRCLHDGHYFCSGTTLTKDTGRVKRHKACGSVFDYVGWRAWGEWRRDVNEREKGKGARAHNPQGLRILRAGKRKDEVHNCAENCDFPSECRWAARLSPGTKASKTGVVSPVVEESEEGALEATDVEMDEAGGQEGEKEPPSPKEPVSPPTPGFPQGDRFPTSPTSPREGGSLLEKLIQSTEKRKSRDLALASLGAEGKGEVGEKQTQQQRGLAMAMAFPVLDFKSFKAGMDIAHGVFARGMGREDKEAEGEIGMERPLFEEDAEMMDIDSLVPPSTIGMGAGRGFTSAPLPGAGGWVGVHGVVGEGDKKADVMQVDTSPPLSPRRNAWDWSIGGLGTAMAFADVGLDFDLVG